MSRKTKAARRRGFGEPLSEFRKSKEDKEGIVAHKHKGDARAVRGRLRATVVDFRGYAF